MVCLWKWTVLEQTDFPPLKYYNKMDAKGEGRLCESRKQGSGKPCQRCEHFFQGFRSLTARTDNFVPESEERHGVPLEMDCT